MRNFLLTLLFTISKVFIHNGYAQEKIASIEKNNHVLANDLTHELNPTKDTIVLRSKRRMHYVYSLNKENKREIDEFVEDVKYNIPVSRLSQGKHLLAVSYEQRKIIFVVRVYDPKASFVATKREEEVASRHN